MTDQTPGTDVAAPRPERQIQRVENLQPMLDSGRFEHFQRASSALMHSTLLNPSVRGDSPQACFSNLMLVFDLSDRWKLPALSIAQCISIVHGKVVYEGKLIAAMLTASLGVRLHYHYTGERGTDAYRIFVADRDWADLSEEDLAQVAPDRYPRGWRVIDGSVADWKTLDKGGKPNPAWTGAAQRNQLSYRGSREWTRLFEPAQLLGVYGDDELDDMQIRMERARDVTPTVPGLSSGFTRPAAATADKPTIEGTATEAAATDPAQDAQEPAQDAAQAQADPAAADAPAADQAKPAAPKKAAAKKPAPAGVEPGDGEISAHQVFEHGLTGGALEDLLDPTMKKAEVAAIEKAWTRGKGELDALLEQALAAGQSGVEIGLTDPKPEETALLRQLELVKAAYAEGQRLREEEAAQDADPGPDAVDADIEGEEHQVDEDDDDQDPTRHGVHEFPPIDAIRDAEPDAVEQAEADADDAAFDTPDAIDDWVGKLDALMDWKSIKSSLGVLVKTEAWKTAGPARQAATRAAAWTREAVLIDGGHDRLDFINDLTAWRCWIETTTDVDAIQGNWAAIVRSPLYQGIEAGQKAALEQATLGRIQQIQSADA